MGDYSRRFVFLTGFMASGKTSLGNLVAERLNVPFYDTDTLIESRENMTVREIFETKGEAYFRQKESEVLQGIAVRENPGIVATGGGIVMKRENRKVMRSNGVIVWMYASPAVLFKRLKSERTVRPLLQGDDWTSSLIELYRKRYSSYLQCHYIFHEKDEMMSDMMALGHLLEPYLNTR